MDALQNMLIKELQRLPKQLLAKLINSKFKRKKIKVS
jgi:hypothetical protein